MASLYRTKEYQSQDDSGNPLNAGTLEFYLTTTATPKSAYPTEGDANAGTNGFTTRTLDSDGRCATEVWLTGRYRIIVKTSAGVTIADDDPVEDFVAASSAQSSTPTYGGANTGTANALAFSVTPALTAYSAGQTLRGRIAADNSAAVTINVNSVGVKSLVKRNGTALVAGDLQGPDIIEFAYDATTDVFRLLSADGAWNNLPARTDVASVAGTTSLDAAGSEYVRITGTNTITGFTLADGQCRRVVAGGAFAITTGASLIVDGLASGTTYIFASGDCFSVYGEASSVVRVRLHQPPRLDAVTATTEVVSSVAETTVYTKSIPGGTLGIDRALRLTLIGDYFNNSGATRELTVKVKYGATTVFNVIFNAVAAAVNRKDFLLTFNLHAKGATNAQVAAGQAALSSLAASQTGINVAQFNHMAGIAGHNASAIDSTAAQDLVVTVQHSVSDANLSFKTLSARLEVVR